jgi:rRNA-processing protein FCF1
LDLELEAYVEALKDKKIHVPQSVLDKLEIIKRAGTASFKGKSVVSSFAASMKAAQLARKWRRRAKMIGLIPATDEE